VTVSELFHAGDLTGAIAAGLEEVRAHPTDSGRRLFLAELLCFGGELERADNQLDALGHNDPQTLPLVSMFRQLIRAEQARQDFFAVGRLPEFLAKPDAAISLLLEASIRARDGALAEAARLLEDAEESRTKLAGTCDGQTFSDFRDLDDQTACVFEVLTTKGSYYWVSMAQVESIEFQQPARSRDILWRRTQLVVRDGPDGEVFIPVLYPGTTGFADDLLRVGRKTDWRGGDGAPVRGAGQRSFLVGDESQSILELKSITFEPRTSN
jgi:type VI secretion system protein ImpE